MVYACQNSGISAEKSYAFLQKIEVANLHYFSLCQDSWIGILGRARVSFMISGNHPYFAKKIYDDKALGFYGFVVSVLCLGTETL